jgi:hypothetical protein
MKIRAIRCLVALGIASSLGLGFGAAASSASGYGHDRVTLPHGHPECASDVWGRESCLLSINIW